MSAGGGGRFKADFGETQVRGRLVASLLVVDEVESVESWSRLTKIYTSTEIDVTHLLTCQPTVNGATAQASAGATESPIAARPATMAMLRCYVRHGSMSIDNAPALYHLPARERREPGATARHSVLTLTHRH